MAEGIDLSSGGVSLATQNDTIGSDFTTTSSSMVVITALGFTLPTNSGKSLVIGSLCCKNGVANGLQTQMFDGATGKQINNINTGTETEYCNSYEVPDNVGQALTWKCLTGAGTLTVEYQFSHVISLEVS